jgi:LysR family carnitine catabolism transcriptional activator
MTLKQIKAFLVLARLLNYAQAAQELCISQSALSLAIKALEAELGGKLFKRNTRKVELTQEGLSLLPNARRLLAHWDEMQHDLKERFRLNRGVLSIASMPYMTHSFLPRMVGDFFQQHRNISLSINDITNETVIEKVKDGIFEIGICFEPQFCGDLNFKPFFEEDFVALLSKDHVLADRESITWQQLCAYPFISLQQPSVVRFMLDEFCAQNNIVLDVKVECHQITSISQFVACNVGVSVIPRSFAQDIHYDTCLIRELSGQRMSRAVGVIYGKESHLSHVGRAFLTELGCFAGEASAEKG